MEATILCIRLVINTWVLLVTQVWDCCEGQNVYAAFPRVVPKTPQHFEYSSVSFDCTEFDVSHGWRLMRKVPTENTACGSSWGIFNRSLCIFRNVYVEDSGQYWCETRDGKKSSTVNITITAGPVILESPVLPAVEGNAVTLRCKSRTPSTKTSASITFYRNSLLIKNISTSTLIIYNISKHHEGLYKCNISGAGESPESWLSVRSRDNADNPMVTPLCSDQLPVLLYLLMRTIAAVLWVALLILVLRKRQCWNN